MTKNIRYRGAVEPIAEYNKTVAQHEKISDREYEGMYRGVSYHHNKGADHRRHERNNHEVKVCYRGNNDVIIVS